MSGESNRLSIISCFCAMLILTACDSQSSVEEQRKDEARQAAAKADEAERAAAKQKERDLLISADGSKEIDRRLAAWLRVEGEVLLLTDVLERSGERRFLQMSSVPVRTPWTVSCSKNGLVVVIGSWSEVEFSADSGSSEDRFSKAISRVPFSEADCGVLVKRLGEKLLVTLRPTSAQ